MNFKIIEKNIISKNEVFEYCEDKIVCNDNFACVIDGATSKSKLLFNKKTSGLKVSEILENAIHFLPKESNLLKTVEILTNAVKEYYSNNNLLEHMKLNPYDRLTASVIIYSKYYNQVWQIGDCQCLIAGKSYKNTKQIDVLLSEIRSFYLAKEFISGKTIWELQQNDTGREYILPFLRAQSYFQNINFQSEYSFCVVDGFKIDLSQVPVFDIRDIDTVILASDGYPKLFDSLYESEKYLNYVLENDPLCYKLFKSTKGKTDNSNSFDDRTYLKIQILY